MKKIFLFLCFLAMAINVTVANAATTLNCNTTMLQNGSTGENVKTLQKELNRVLKCNLDIDGIIGSKTTACIVKFQKTYGLETDGIVGPKTCTKLNTKYNTLSKINYGVVIGDEVNVRKGPGTDSEILTTVKQGTVLRIYGETTVDGKTWYRIYKNGTYASISANDVKKTAILLDISSQQLTYYNNGKILLNAPVITGKKDTNDTPTGKYIINPNKKSQNQTLTGTNNDGSSYAAFVNYWMPFIEEKEIGFHDASWRNIDDYNKKTYIENGSHGCVNMRYNDAKILYENIKEETYVIIQK